MKISALLLALILISLSLSCRVYRAWRYDRYPIQTIDQVAIYPPHTVVKVYGRITSYDAASGTYVLDHEVQFQVSTATNHPIFKHNTEIIVSGRTSFSTHFDNLSIVDVFDYSEVSLIPTSQLQAVRSATKKDSDSDGMTDYWEIRYGLNPNNNLDANKDSDDDSLVNKTEFTIKTNPNVPNSVHIVSPEEFKH